MSPRAACRLEQLGFHQIYDYAAGKSAWASCGLPLEGESAADRAGALARSDVPTCRPVDTLAHVPESTRQWGLCVVVDEGHCVLGVIRTGDLACGPGVHVEAVMQQPTTLRPSARRDDLREHFARSGRRSAIVTTLDGRLVGVVRREDVARH
jgi:Mg/Co/Ni transporter MgtE